MILDRLIDLETDYTICFKESRKSFPDYLVDVLHRHGLTYRGAQEVFGASYVHLVNIANHKARPSFELMKRVREYDRCKMAVK